MRRATAFIVAVLFTACASITSPNGGRKDIIPPELINSNPAANQTNFKGKEVVLSFDEDIQLKNPKEEIIITPPPGKDVQIRARGTKVTIAPPDGWKDSTTYSLQFREGIQDITEGNVPKNLKLAFSTGPYIDSLQIKGKTRDVLKGTDQANITVALYQQDTFDIFTDHPEYFTKTSKSGDFTLDNLKPGSYRIYAFDDKNKNLKVESRTERFGFLSGALRLTDNLDSVDFGLVQVDSRILKINNIRNSGPITRLKLNKNLTEYSVKTDLDLIHAFADSRDEIVFWNPDGVDSLQLTFSALDSIGSAVDSIFYIKKTKARYAPDPLKWSLGSPTLELETGKFTTTLTFNKPIADIAFDSLYVELDTLTRVPVVDKEISLDLPNKRLTIRKDIDKKLIKKENAPLMSLKAGLGVFTTIESDTSKRLSTRVALLNPEDLGILLVKVISTSKYYIIELITPDGKVTGRVANVANYSFKNVPPGEYQLRVILDSNHNGKWDPGNIYLGREPERVIFYKPPGTKTTFPVRANWELGPLPLRF